MTAPTRDIQARKKSLGIILSAYFSRGFAATESHGLAINETVSRSRKYHVIVAKTPRGTFSLLPIFRHRNVLPAIPAAFPSIARLFPPAAFRDGLAAISSGPIGPKSPIVIGYREELTA
jgi:hypothetical protein